MREIKSVSELAEELQVSKVTIYNHINRIDKKGNVTKKNNVQYLTKQGQELIKSRIVKDKEEPNELIDLLKETVTRLENQLEIKDNEIKQLLEQLNNKDNQITNLIETMKLDKVKDREQQFLNATEQIKLEDNKSIIQRFKDLFK